MVTRLLLVVGLLIPVSVQAATPTSLTVQGRLTDAGGVPFPPGGKSFTFRIFTDSVAGVKVWPQSDGEVQTLTTTSDGLWIALIGAIEPLSDGVFSAASRWLEIEIDATILPRTRLVTGPFAFRVATIDGASGGHVSSSVAIGGASVAPGANALAAGGSNAASGGASAVVGGDGNSAASDYSAVLGGSQNTASGNQSAIAGGNNNQTATDAFVGGGVFNRASGVNSAVIAGVSDTAGGSRSIVLGGSGNAIAPSGSSSSVLGGEANRITADLSAIVGGEANSVTNINSSIGGGEANKTSGPWSVIDGGLGNEVSAQGSTIGGGFNNRARGFYSTVAGGGGLNGADSNLAAGTQSFIGGGRRNIANLDQTTVAGGDGNRALGTGAFIGGGLNNIASGLNAVVSGGAADTANGTHSMIPGGLGNRASGAYSLAAGRRAKAQHDGAFVWGDDQDATFASTNPRQFLIRAAGGIGINTNAPEKALHVVGSAKFRDTVFAGYFSSTSPLVLQTGGVTRLYIDEASGNVSINASIPPTARLQVGGVIHSTTGGVRFPDGRAQLIGGLIAFGHVDSVGNVHASSGNVSCSYDNVNGRYLITISGESYSPLSYVTNITCDGSLTATVPMIGSFGSQMSVTLFDLAGNKRQGGFQFVTFKH